jgi:hypothetical protein
MRHYEVAKYLLEKGANPNIKGGDDAMTVLDMEQIAGLTISGEMKKFLRSHGAKTSKELRE